MGQVARITENDILRVQNARDSAYRELETAKTKFKIADARYSEVMEEYQEQDDLDEQEEQEEQEKHVKWLEQKRKESPAFAFWQDTQSRYDGPIPEEEKKHYEKLLEQEKGEKRAK